MAIIRRAWFPIVLVVVALVAFFGTGPKAASPAPSSTPTPRALASAPPSTSAAAVTPAADFDAVWLDGPDNDTAYWRRAAQLLTAQDDVKLHATGDVKLRFVHGGQAVTLYRNDLDGIALNACIDKTKGTEAASTVGWITSTYQVQRRWEAAQLRQAALETKCPAA